MFESDDLLAGKLAWERAEIQRLEHVNLDAGSLRNKSGWPISKRFVRVRVRAWHGRRLRTAARAIDGATNAEAAHRRGTQLCRRLKRWRQSRCERVVQ